MRRRVFIAGALAAVAAAALARVRGWWPRRDAASSPPPPAPQSLSTAAFPARYRDALAAMTHRLLPRSGDFPGAQALGAWQYIEREVARPEMRGTHRLLLRGATQLDVLARAQGDRPFAELGAGEQDAVISAMASGAGRKGAFEPAVFVRTMLALALEGAFADPVHGGNAGESGWRWLGYAMHPPRPGACSDHGAGCE